MNERGNGPQASGEGERVLAFTEMPTDGSAIDAEEIRGWALQWDTVALRKANLARRMRFLRNAGVEKPGGA